MSYTYILIYSFPIFYKTIYICMNININIYIYIYTYKYNFSVRAPELRTGPGAFGTFSSSWPFWPAISTYPAAPGRHSDITCSYGTTFRPILLLQDDISTCLAAPGRHFDLSVPMGRHFDLSSCSGRHFDLSGWSGTEFRPVPECKTSTYPAAPGRHFDSCSSTTTFELLDRSCVRNC